MAINKTSLAPGARIVVRDAEWLVQRVDSTNTGGQQLECVGLSELVRGKESIFLSEYETNIELLDPKDTELVHDDSRGYEATILYMESLLRQKAPTDDNLYIGYKAAMDVVPYQLDPAIQALSQARQRILISDAVGLGKTLEAGVLVSELIKRGRGKRILVVATKSMLTQFQKEFWTRFTIPLIRLDSTGLQRIRYKIPTNHNPFYYYDKSIISIDTLKNDTEYRTYIENAYWDIIVIDEAHNVADRGSGALRNKLANLLSHHSDTLIMLSATPHDGRAKSFASLMNMLDPTAIADPENYTPEDIKGLYIRRFKKDIQQQVKSAFKEREISLVKTKATTYEEKALRSFTDLQFKKIDSRRTRGHLFKTTLEKSLFSSPFACIETINNRISTLKEKESDYKDDIKQLASLRDDVADITFDNFSKYKKLLEVIRNDFNWKGNDTTDRLVIFTERIATLKHLETQLAKDLKLKKEQVSILHGGLSDQDQMKIVEEFGKESSPIRILVASDVASEGINLHYLCHKMIHFDIPWSLMVFQQRNGRIDRYGQENTPRIVYLMTKSENEKIRGDNRILEILIEKDEQANKNINDPSSFSGLDIDEEEKNTAEAIEKGKSAEEYQKSLEIVNPLELLLRKNDIPTGDVATSKQRDLPGVLNTDYDYVKKAIEFLKRDNTIQVSFNDSTSRIELTAPLDLQVRFKKNCSKELRPKDWLFVLSPNADVVQKEMKRCRKDDSAWPKVQYLWDQHPIIDWINDKVLAYFGRRQAPVVSLKEHLDPEEVVYICSGIIPNRKSHPLVHEWMAVYYKKNRFDRIETLDDFLKRVPIGKINIANSGSNQDVTALQSVLPEVVEKVHEWITEKWNSFETEINAKLQSQLKALEFLKVKQCKQLELDFGEVSKKAIQTLSKKQERQREIDRVFNEFFEWVEDTMTTENNPFIQIISVFRRET